MDGKVNDLQNMRQVQGDRVLVFALENGGAERLCHVLTLVRLVDKMPGCLHLSNRDRVFSQIYVDWPVVQDYWDALSPARDNEYQAKWELAVEK